ncbi:HEXXH motif domain-containing protein [Actinoplanes utahensis]|uniref:HEXXH motif domain-containing protein n=1 Tax=Actinoplanes utahensis TaxID=1869 RepID=UPI00069236DC|nr:HEXXH motif domain-containing protein [Actinoplanes utahensis]GIF32094.1 HEXXH motif domain-containing protein [Actinoplanes utahensis]
MGQTAGHEHTLHNHRIPVAQLAELNAGGGSVSAIRTLWAGQRSRRILLLDAVLRAAAGDPARMGPLPPVDEAWTIIGAVDPGDLLLHPQVGSWAAYVVRRSRNRATSEAPFWIDVGTLHTIALILAARAGISWRTRVPARDGRVMLPALGMASFPGLRRWDTVEAGCEDGVIHLRAGGRDLLVPDGPAPESPGWWPLRRIRSGDEPRLSVFLDDIDPFRELADPVAPERLDAGAVSRWTDLLDGAWSVLCRDHPATAEALAAGVVSLVPLPDDRTGITRSASTGEAFGSVMISPPSDEVDLAVSLVHEFQHIKLGGLIHLTALTTGPAPPVRYAPWRDDPRPLPGLVQGVYAFFGIADFWRVRRLHTEGRRRTVADFAFRYARDQVETALRELSAADGLTEAGRRLVDGLAKTVESWPDEQADPVAATVAARLCTVHRLEWRIRHVVPDPDLVRRLAADWPAASPVDLGPFARIVRPHPELRWSSGWQSAAWAHVTARAGERTGIDVAVVTGDDDAARAAAVEGIAASPADPRAWAALASTAPPRSPLATCPELVCALHAALRDRGVHADPLTTAGWLDRVLPVGADDPVEVPEVG